MKKCLFLIPFAVFAILFFFITVAQFSTAEAKASCHCNVKCTSAEGQFYENQNNWGGYKWPYGQKDWNKCKKQCQGYLNSLNLKAIAEGKGICGVVSCSASYKIGTKKWRGEETRVADVKCDDPSCINNCTKPIIKVFVAGDQDNTVAGDPADLTSPSLALQVRLDLYNNGIYPNREFDVQVTDRVFGHTFTGLPANIIGATLEIHLRGPKNNDGINLEFDGTSFAWGRRIEDLPGAADNGQYNIITLDLAALPTPSGTANILSAINGKLDVYVQDDTAVHYMVLAVIICDD